MKKYSKQRERIIENLRGRTDHPTAEELYIDLKRQMPELGIATVYRNLSELCEDRVIRKIKVKLGPDRYDGNRLPHMHFECKECGKLIDIYLQKEQIEQLNDIAKQVLEGKKVAFGNLEMYLTGLCEKCSK